MHTYSLHSKITPHWFPSLLILINTHQRKIHSIKTSYKWNVFYALHLWIIVLRDNSCFWLNMSNTLQICVCSACRWYCYSKILIKVNHCAYKYGYYTYWKTMMQVKLTLVKKSQIFDLNIGYLFIIFFNLKKTRV